MSNVTRAFGDLIENVVAFIVMIFLATVSFYFTVFVVATGSGLAGQAPGGNFVVLSAALLVVAAILAGGLSPVSALSGMSNANGSNARSRSEDGSSSAASVDEPIVADDDDAESVRSLGQFQLYQDRAAEWRWRLVHRNGNVIATGGQGYSSRDNAEKGMRSVMTNAADANVTTAD